MEMTEPHSFRPSLSLFQMMKLVVFGAVASACIAPAYHLYEFGLGTWPTLLILEGVCVPLTLALAAFPLVRKGPLKDWLIRLLLLTSISIALGFATYLLIFVAYRWFRGRMLEIAFLASDLGVITILVLAFSLLARGIILLKCPECSRRALILDAKAKISPPDMSGRPYQCLRCRQHYFKPYGSKMIIQLVHEPATR